MGEFFRWKNATRLAPLLVALQSCVAISFPGEAVAGTLLDPYSHIREPGLYNDPNNPALEELPDSGGLLVCGPLRIKNGTGSPARIFALIP